MPKGQKWGDLLGGVPLYSLAGVGLGKGLGDGS